MVYGIMGNNGGAVGLNLSGRPSVCGTGFMQEGAAVYAQQPG